MQHDERDLAEAAAEFGDVQLEYSSPSAADVADVEARDLATRPTTTLQVELAASRRAAERGIHTILSGWGGDELSVYNGKGYFASLARRGRFPTLWRELSLRSNIHDSKRLSEIRGRVILPMLPDRLAVLAQPELRRQPFVWPAYLRPEAAAALAAVEPLELPSLRERPGVRRLQIAKLRFGHLQYRMESWAAHGADLGITYAFPLLDQRIIEFALSIPDHLYFKHGWKRWLYRTAMEGTLPDEVRWNPHKFDAAMVERLRQLRAETRRLLQERTQERADNPYVDVEQMWSASSQADAATAAFLAFTDAEPPR
jgi:asparagine synthase (glutamine-hydrolysing)